MRRSRKSVAAAAALLGVLAYSTSATLAQSRSTISSALDDVTSLRCFSGKGYSVTWDAGVPKFTSARFPSEGDHIQFDAIDRENHSARLIGNAGVSEVRVIESDRGLHFLEYTPSGNLNVTTVFSAAPKGLPPRSFVFVASRHLDLGDPATGPSIIASQYHGTCKAWE